MGAPVTYTAKLESVAASAVKAADKVGAALMVVVTHTGAVGDVAGGHGFFFEWGAGPPGHCC
jgi:hypothetical protein